MEEGTEPPNYYCDKDLCGHCCWWAGTASLVTGEAWRGQEVFQRIIWTLKEARKKQKREMPWRNGRWTREGAGSQGVPPVVLLLPVPPGSKSPWDSLPPRLSSGLRRCSKCFQASDQVAPPPCPRPVSTKESGAARLLLPVHRFLYLFPFTVSYYKHPFLKAFNKRQRECWASVASSWSTFLSRVLLGKHPLPPTLRQTWVRKDVMPEINTCEVNLKHLNAPMTFFLKCTYIWPWISKAEVKQMLESGKIGGGCVLSPVLIQLCGTAAAPARTCQSCQLGLAAAASNPKQSLFMATHERWTDTTKIFLGLTKI